MKPLGVKPVPTLSPLYIICTISLFLLTLIYTKHRSCRIKQNDKWCVLVIAHSWRWTCDNVSFPCLSVCVCARWFACICCNISHESLNKFYWNIQNRIIRGSSTVHLINFRSGADSRQLLEPTVLWTHTTGNRHLPLLAQNEQQFLKTPHREFPSAWSRHDF